MIYTKLQHAVDTAVNGTLAKQVAETDMLAFKRENHHLYAKQRAEYTREMYVFYKDGMKYEYIPVGGDVRVIGGKENV